MPIRIPAQISIPLDIEEVDVLSTKEKEKGKLVIKVESRQETIACGICGEEIRCNYGRGQEIELRHLPILGQETYIAIRPKRGQCQACLHQPTTTQVLDWYEQRSPHTKAYDEYLMKQLIGSSVADVSLKEKVGYSAILGALQREVTSEIDWSQVKDLGTIGIDEVSYKKGRKHYRAVVTARQDDGTVIILAVLPNRKKKTVSDFLMTIPARLRSTIHTFCSDMWSAYLTAIAEFIANHPEVEAYIVVDRFHVAQCYRDNFDTLRKKEFRRLKKELPDETYQDVVSGMYWVLRHNYAHLDEDDKVRLRTLFHYTPDLHQAYTFREELTAIFNTPLSLADGRSRLQKWMVKVERSPLHCFDKFLKTLHNHFSFIANYFHHRASSGFVEGVNNKLRVITRRSYGLKRIDSLFRRLWLDLVGRVRLLA